MPPTTNRGLQSGLTLLEVLVGFVIFTLSLVAILDYVGEQVFHVHRSGSHLQRLQQLYVAAGSGGGLEVPTLHPGDAAAEGFDWRVVATELDAVEVRDELLLLNRYDISVSNANNSLNWSVIRQRRGE